MSDTQDDAAGGNPAPDTEHLAAEVERLTTLLALETDQTTRLTAELDAAHERITELDREIAERRRAMPPPPAPPVHPDFPRGVKLLAPHGFIEEGTGRHRFWNAGDVVADPAEVALLIGRGAALGNR